MLLLTTVSSMAGAWACTSASLRVIALFATTVSLLTAASPVAATSPVATVLSIVAIFLLDTILLNYATSSTTLSNVRWSSRICHGGLWHRLRRLKSRWIQCCKLKKNLRAVWKFYLHRMGSCPGVYGARGAVIHGRISVRRHIRFNR